VPSTECKSIPGANLSRPCKLLILKDLIKGGKLSSVVDRDIFPIPTS